MAWIVGGLAGLLAGVLTLLLVVPRIPSRWLRARPVGTLAQADFLVVLDFGMGRNGIAGASNEALADWLLSANSARKPTLIQEGVHQALRERERQQPELKLGSWVVPLPHDKKAQMDTTGAALQCWLIATARGWSRPAVVAHDLHQQRAGWLFARLYGADRVVLPELPEIPFDADSVQHWSTRSQTGWLFWELPFARPAMGAFEGLLALLSLGLTAAAVVGLAVGYLLVFLRL